MHGTKACSVYMMLRTGTFNAFSQLLLCALKFQHICVNNFKSSCSAILIWLEILKTKFHSPVLVGVLECDYPLSMPTPGLQPNVFSSMVNWDEVGHSNLSSVS